VVGSLKTITDETASTTEKIEAKWSMVVGAGSAIANAFMPGSGFLIQGIAGLIKGTLELTGIWEHFVSVYETSAEKI